jgi:hypothetical protein
MITHSTVELRFQFEPRQNPLHLPCLTQLSPSIFWGNSRRAAAPRWLSRFAGSHPRCKVRGRNRGCHTGCPSRCHLVSSVTTNTPVGNGGIFSHRTYARRKPALSMDKIWCRIRDRRHNATMGTVAFVGHARAHSSSRPVVTRRVFRYRQTRFSYETKKKTTTGG